MYDANTEPHEFFGSSREEAVAKAASYFRCAEGELEVRPLDPNNVNGLGPRSVVVAWPQGHSPRGKRADSDDDRGGDRDRGDRGGRGGRDRDRGDRGGRGSGGDRDRGRGARDRGDRGGRGGGRERGERSDRPERSDRGGRGDQDRGRGDREAPLAAAAAAPAATPRGDVGPSKGTAKGSLGEIGKFLLGAIELMELGPFEISETEEDRFLVYSLSGAAAESLSSDGARGQEALQLLANQAASRQDPDAKRIVLDVEGDSERRESLLERGATRAAKRARDTGRSVALDAMNGRDRRAVHMALRDTEGVATMSIGEGRFRQVLVVPEGAAEYDEAVESCRQSDLDD